MRFGRCPAAKSRPRRNRPEMAALSAATAAAGRIESPTCVGRRTPLRLRCVKGDTLLHEGGPADSAFRVSVSQSQIRTAVALRETPGRSLKAHGTGSSAMPSGPDLDRRTRRATRLLYGPEKLIYRRYGGSCLIICRVGSQQPRLPRVLAWARHSTRTRGAGPVLAPVRAERSARRMVARTGANAGSLPGPGCSSAILLLSFHNQLKQQCLHMLYQEAEPQFSVDSMLYICSPCIVEQH